MKTLLVLFALLATVASAQEPAKPTTPPQPPTMINADLGSCRVDFKVTDLQGKPIYNAKVKTTIRYGFLSKRKLSLEAGTNAEGRVRFAKLPNSVKNSIEFEISYGEDTSTIVWDPGNNCVAEYPIMLGKKPDSE